MQLSAILIGLLLVNDVGVAATDDLQPVDALLPEHMRAAIARLDDPSFQEREQATQALFASGFDAIFPLSEAMETLTPEASVRAFGILLQLYRQDDERTYEQAERAFRRLMHVKNLATTARAERLFNMVTDLRQTRGMAKFMRLGGVVQYENPNSERNTFGRGQIKYLLIGRNWMGGDEGLKLIESIQEVHYTQTHFFVIRGCTITEEALLDLRAELPFLLIQRRGPSRLGVGSSFRGSGCTIENVEEGSAAQRAGLVSRDQIIEIDGEPIDDFESLVKVIEKKEPGDRVPIVFVRGASIHKVEAELLPWHEASTEKPTPPKP